MSSSSPHGSSLDTELLQLIVESATDFAIFTMDPNGITTSWNPGGLKVLGYEEHEIVGKPADLIFPPEEPDAAAEERRVALAQGRAEDERWQVRKDGTRIWASGLLMPLKDRQQGFVKILRDRTSQHQSEEQLKASESLFRVLLNSIPQLVFRATARGDRTWVSPKWSIYSGISFSDSLQMGWLEAVHPDDRHLVRNAWLEDSRGLEVVCEYRLRRASDGQYRWHQARAVPLDARRPNETEWIGAASDIHDLRLMKMRQEILVHEMEHRTRNILTMVSSIAAQTIRSSVDREAIESDLRGRLRALSRTVGAVSASSDQLMDIELLIRAELSPYSEDSSATVTIGGPATRVPVAIAQSLVLAIHELATNAAKYGVFAQSSGELTLKWTLAEVNGDQVLRVRWTEVGITVVGDAVRRKGYGTELILDALPYSTGAQTRFEFRPNGVDCEILFTLPRE